MRYIAIFCMLFAGSCTTGPALIGTDPAGGDADRLLKFLRLCEKDLRSAKKIVADNNIVNNLSHLQRMNAGGSKYYILEKENITKLIKSVTEGIYADFILINSKGTVIYTRSNDLIFSKNVRTSLAETPLHRCCELGKEEVHFEDISQLSKTAMERSFFPAISIDGDELSSGTFILQIDMPAIRAMIGSGTQILNIEGMTLVPPHPDEQVSRHPEFNEIKKLCERDDGSRVLTENGIYCRMLRYRDLTWFIISGK